jgi:hypothetical protein|tara:strand:- start:1415 stop:1660 length:246 start_codon:yes stop_codon:yes gene_type:complete
VAKQSQPPSINVQQARNRLDAALERLEKAFEKGPKDGGDQSGLAAELSTARDEIGSLKDSNKAVSKRIDSAIGKVRDLIGD